MTIEESLAQLELAIGNLVDQKNELLKVAKNAVAVMQQALDVLRAYNNEDIRITSLGMAIEWNKEAIAKAEVRHE